MDGLRINAFQLFFSLFFSRGSHHKYRNYILFFSLGKYIRLAPLMGGNINLHKVLSASYLAVSGIKKKRKGLIVRLHPLICKIRSHFHFGLA